ncbi:MAG: photosynthetic complex putative assembly protein PuhB [Pseudomonadota bacterium]
MSQHNEYEFEPTPGLPARLPEGEHIVWQGSPERGELARGALHVRKIGLYFILLALWRVAAGLADGLAASAIAFSTIGTLLLGALALAVLFGIAHAMAKTTIYTITNRRVVMRFGVALPMTFQLPFSQITNADMVRATGTSGSIALTTKEHTKLVWPVLWPHVRPWKLAKPQPTLRALADVGPVAQLLAENLRAAHGMEPTPTIPDTADAEAKASAVPGTEFSPAH